MYVFSHFDIDQKEFQFKLEKEKITMEKKRKKYVGYVTIKKIIEVWAQYNQQLHGMHKNSHIYAKINTQLENKHGVLLATDELRNRINNLAKKYRFVNNFTK